MTPVFKSTYSIGKSILTLDDDDKEGGPDSIFTICEENKIKSLVLVEDSMTGFVTAHNRCKEKGIDLVFGLRLTCCNNTLEDDNSDHKIVILPTMMTVAACSTEYIPMLTQIAER